MPVTYHWVVTGRILLTRLEGNVAVPDLIEAAQEGTAMVNDGTYPVYCIVDATALEGFPMSLSELTPVFSFRVSDKLGPIIGYGLGNNNKIAKLLAAIFARFVRRRFHVVETFEQAMLRIENYEKGLLNAAMLNAATLKEVVLKKKPLANRKTHAH